MIRDYELIHDITILYYHKFVLYGASTMGKQILQKLRELNVEIIGFCDSDKAKVGELVDGCRVMSFDELKTCYSMESGIAVIISSSFVEEVSQILEKENIDAYSIYGLQVSILLNLDDDRLPQAYVEKVRNGLSLYKEKASLEMKSELLRTRIWALLEAAEQDKVWVFQCGKVGSMSIVHGLEQSGVPVLHFHRLAYDRRLYSDGCRKEYNHFLKRLQEKRIKIITLVREPISRDLSDFGYRFLDEEKIPVWLDYGLLTHDLSQSFSYVAEKFFYGFNNGYHMRDEWVSYETKGYMFEWFNVELKKTLGVDVYKYPFNKERGYAVIKEHNVEVLVLKLEKLGNLSDIICHFLNVPDFNLSVQNRGVDKNYRHVYRELTKKIRLSRDYINLYYKDNPYMDHFYSSDEKKIFLQKWGEHIVD